jgi:hypothetical protein
MRVVFWITNATETRLEYVNTRFHWQQWLLERSSVLSLLLLPVLFKNMAMDACSCDSERGSISTKCSLAFFTRTVF